jgi:hypothetical protein
VSAAVPWSEEQQEKNLVDVVVTPGLAIDASEDLRFVSDDESF